MTTDLSLRGIRGTLVLLLLIPGCSSRERLKLEVRRQTIQGRQEVVYVLVDPAKLSEAGISTEEPKHYVESLLDGVGAFIAEALVESVTGAASDPPSSRKQEEPPGWVSRVFPSGIPLEIVVTERDGSQRTEKLVVPTPRSR